MASFDLEWAAGNFPRLKDTGAKLNAKRAELKAIFDEAGPDLDPKKVTSVKVNDGVDLHEVVAAANTELNDLSDEYQKLINTAKAAFEVRHGEGAAVEAGAPEAPQARRGVAFGEQFVQSDAFKNYTAGQGVGPMAHIDINLAEFLRPQATLFETGAGWAPESTRTGHLQEFATRPAPDVVDFIPQIPTGMASVKYMEETTLTNAAAETAEGGTYPESALALTERDVAVRKVSTWLPVTDEQLEDVPFARAYVDGRLVFFLRQRLDSQVLVGNGTPPNLRGTENVVGINTQALGSDSIPDAIYKGMTTVRDTGFAEPSVVFIRPAKWQNVRLLKTADGVYIWGHPSEAGPERIWGVPVKQTTAVTATKAVLGDYANHSFLAVRRGVDVQITNTHGTHFVEGKQAVRADVRVAMVHLRPAAFTAVTGL
jgi:HK97 family phage major capsid protein